MLGLTGSPALAAAVAIGYLLGSIPFGLLLTRLAGMGDVRAIGSGNIGATNVLRTGKKSLAGATLLLDGGKGAAAAFLFADSGAEAMIVAALAAVVGHVFPIWLKFSGGKGVATALGVLLALSWQVGLLACATWLAVAALTRYSSLAALVALVLSPAYAYWLAGPDLALAGVGIALLVGFRHRQNISRLIDGSESKIGR